MQTDPNKREQSEVNPNRQVERQATDDWGKFNKGRERKMWEQVIDDASEDDKDGEQGAGPKTD
jgi:hypothetical protein